MTTYARQRITMSDSEIEDRFSWYGYSLRVKDLCFTTESVEDFREARDAWFKAGRTVEDEPGLLFIKQAQPRPTRPERDVVVIDFGSARAVMGSDCKHDDTSPVHHCSGELR